jgi:exopolysaccharide biosynthesis polyprenyl glycosylphosphotransferase
MIIRTNNPAVTSVVTKNKNIILKNKFISRHQGFQVPFSERRTLLVFVDTLFVLLAILGAFMLWELRAGGAFDIITRITARWYWFPIMLGGWWLLAWLNDLYDIRSSGNMILSAIRMGVVGGLFLGIYMIIYFLAAPALPRLFFIHFLLLAIPSIIFWRWAYALVFNASPFRRRILIIGEGSKEQTIADALGRESPTNHQVLGYITDKLMTPGESLNGLPVLGRETDLPHLVQQLRIHEVVLAIEYDLDSDLFQLLIDCQAQGVKVSGMPELYEKLYRSIPVRDIDPSWALGVMQDWLISSRLQLAAKRLMDLGIGLVGLLVTAPFWPLIVLAIRLDSPGPVFYRQVRCGKAGKPFSIIKFRTMGKDAEQDGQARWATKDDVRITRVGHFLRKTRLDELPQVLNVLSGEMSIVGPRPERPEFVEQLQQNIPFYRTRLMVKPGLTGWAQVHHSYANSIEDAVIKLQYDFYYLRYWSLWLDIYTIFRTFWVVLTFKGT